ncbi:MAG: YIP1 family protein [Acholeplasma sp.]
MKKKIIIIILFMLNLIVSINLSTASVITNSAPYNTFTIGPSGDLVLTQTAYEPAGILAMDAALNQPQDMYIKDDYIYIADTGNKRILKTDLSGNIDILLTGLGEPTGVHVDENNLLYVADRLNRTITIYDEMLNIVNVIERPTEPIFGLNSPFVPLKISSGPRGVIYVTGEGSVSGVMQFNRYGDFLGYLATNPTQSSFYRQILEWFNQELAPITPVSPDNLTIDEKGSVYTTSITEYMPIKKYNIASRIVLSPMHYGQTAPSAVFINDFGNIYTITDKGIIHEYDSSGNLLFVFGIDAPNTEILGLFNRAVDIVVDSNYNLIILDRGRGQIQILERSEFTALVHDGLKSLNSGIYDVQQWEDILRMNSVFALANSVIARTYFRTGDYQTALSYYEIAQDKTGYSDAFWQVRNNFLQNYLGGFLAFGLILGFVYLIMKQVDKKYAIYDPIRNYNKKLNNIKIIRELKLGMQVFRHPIDTFHEIKHEQKASKLSAIILYALYVILNVLAVLFTGFLFNDNNLETYNVLTSFLSSLGLLMLFVFSNYLISTLSNGEGWFKDVFISTAYALMPYIILTVPLILLSHALTLNEIFIFQSVLYIRDAWILLLIVLMIIEIHNYSFRELIKNILLTLFAMAVIVAMLILIYLLVNQMYDYISSIIREVWNRV